MIKTEDKAETKKMTGTVKPPEQKPSGNKKQAYGNESISALKGPDRVRLRPSVIFGSDGLEGCQHSFLEILSNSIDEAREGHGSVILVTRFADKSIMIKDEGRGIPLDFNQREGRYNWELVFCELYAGGKYNNNAGENYEYSLGLNGLGSCATQYSSEYMDVTVFRDGFKFELHFEKGNNIGGLVKIKYNNKHTGTTQKWRPDLAVFTDIGIPLEYFISTLKKQAVVNAGLLFVLHDEESAGTFEFCYKDGITGYVRELNGESINIINQNINTGGIISNCNSNGVTTYSNGSSSNKLTEVKYFEGATKGRDRDDKPEYKVKMQVAFCFNNEMSNIEYYHNSSFLEYGGSPDRAARAAFTAEIDKLLRAKNKYTKDENKITFADIQESLILVINSSSTVTSYENQTKKSITNKFIQEALTDFLKAQLEVYFIENKAECDKVLEQMLLNKRSRETAEKTRINIKKKLTGGTDMANRVKKFVDCRTKDTNKREIYIVEGDSALGSCKLGRDAEFQAVIPVRGKILNCLKAEYDSIFKNEIITDLLKVLGCGVEIRTRHNRDLSAFNLALLRWNKIIICTDADVDGFQIRTLILAMFYRLVPTLIEEGRVYIAETPLFEIKTKNKTFFAYNEKEKNDILVKAGGKATISRSKGLGENDPDMMWQTTMNPATRRLVRITPYDAAMTAAAFELLLGDNLQGRKTFIEENGHKYLDMIDVG